MVAGRTLKVFGRDGNVFPHSRIERMFLDYPVSNVDTILNQPLRNKVVNPRITSLITSASPKKINALLMSLSWHSNNTAYCRCHAITSVQGVHIYTRKILSTHSSTVSTHVSTAKLSRRFLSN